MECEAHRATEQVLDQLYNALLAPKLQDFHWRKLPWRHTRLSSPHPSTRWRKFPMRCTRCNTGTYIGVNGMTLLTFLLGFGTTGRKYSNLCVVIILCYNN